MNAKKLVGLYLAFSIHNKQFCFYLLNPFTNQVFDCLLNQSNNHLPLTLSANNNHHPHPANNHPPDVPSINNHQKISNLPSAPTTSTNNHPLLRLSTNNYPQLSPNQQ